MPNLLHFLLDLSALYALRHAPNFYEIHPCSNIEVCFRKFALKPTIARNVFKSLNHSHKALYICVLEKNNQQNHILFQKLQIHFFYGT
jgi:hypothetical protein